MAVPVHAPAELLLARIFDVAPVGLGLIDPEGRYSLVNPALAAMNGRPVEEHLGRTPAQVLGAVGVELETNVREVAASGEAILDLEIEDPRPPGGRFVAHYMPVALEGEARGVLAVVEDVSARRENEVRARALVEANVVGVVVASEDEILEANDAFLALVGRERSEVEAGGLGWAAVTPPEWRELHDAKLAEMRTHGFAAPYEKECLRKDGARVPILTAGAALSRAPLRVISFVVDFSEREALLRAERDARDERDHILASIGEAFIALDRSWRYTYVNARAEDVLGRPAAKLLGREIWELYPELRGTEFETAYRRAMAGESVEVEARLEAGDRWLAVRAHPGLNGISILVRDVTERHELLARERAAAERARRLARMAAGLAAAVTVEEVAAVAVREAVEALDAAAGALVGVEAGRFHLIHHEGYGARADAWEGRPVDRLPGPLPEAMVTGEVVTVASLEQWAERYGAPAAGLGNQAFVAIPMPGRHGALGALGLAFAAPRELGPEEPELLMALGRQVAQALDRARLYEERSTIAHTLQQGLLPRSLPEIPGVEVALRYQPLGDGAEVGGDFYDVFQSGEDEWAVVVGDVCGKGTEAAVLTGMVRNTIRAIAMRERDPGAILAFLNGAILRHGERNRFCTVAMAKLLREGDGLRVLLGSGGHLPPLVRRADGTLEVAEVSGELLGVFSELALEQAELKLGPGDSLVFYTDGITDARADGEGFGEDRLQALVAAEGDGGAEELADRLDRAVRAWEPHEPRDDRAIVVVHVEGGVAPVAREAPPSPELERVRTVALGGRAEDVARARAAAEETAARALARDGLERLRLLTSELVTNVLRHTSTGHGEVQVRVEHDGVRVEVHDDGRGFRPGPRDPEAEGGFGLLLVERLADRWGTVPGTVWFEIDSSAEPEADEVAS